MHHATFVLSTGRCGTQWLAEVLAGAAARVEHEPLHNNYAPRQMLGTNDPAALDARRAHLITAHVDSIERELAVRNYIETGHPCWSSIRWLAQRLAGRIQVVHLVRHPVPTACSWVSHGAFVPPLLPHLPAKEFISPFDAGVNFPEYRATWASLAPIEKCLVYWAEVNAFALRLEQEIKVPWLRVRYEELFESASEVRVRLVQFLGLPAEMTGRLDSTHKVDRHRFMLAQRPELERIGQHPRVAAVTEALGYRLEDFSLEQLTARFLQ